MIKTILQAYVLGINEGRALLKANPDYTRDDMLAILDNIKSTLRRGFSGDMSDMLRGERDFWKHQLKIKGE